MTLSDFRCKLAEGIEATQALADLRSIVPANAEEQAKADEWIAFLERPRPEIDVAKLPPPMSEAEVQEFLRQKRDTGERA